MAKKLKKFVPKKQSQTEDNQWLQKELFKELPLDDITPNSQLYVLQYNERGDGVYLRPIRTTVEDLLAGGVNIRTEGDAFSSYLPYQIFDEGEATTTYTSDQEFDEGGA